MSPLDNNPQPGAPAPSGSGSAQSSQQDVVKFAKPPSQEVLLPTLLGGGPATYEVRPENFLLSFVTHTAAIALLFWIYHVTIQPKLSPPKVTEAIELTSYIPMKVGKGGPSGGGGGDASKLKASTGVPPRAAKEQFAPPVVLQQQKSKLMVEPTVVAD
ncbi:MAG TPA: hypothetical protein VFR08_01320, partial [Candidatus Angelobacter sp.]|nr:hypothetical protein [Candidatus Angelobacter sp.]